MFRIVFQEIEQQRAKLQAPKMIFTHKKHKKFQKYNRQNRPFRICEKSRVFENFYYEGTILYEKCSQFVGSM